MRIRLTLQGQPILLRIPERTVFVPNLIGLLNASMMTVRPGDTVFDASTGSGIHAVLAAKLGARRVIACDVSPHAVKAARLNARLNGVADRCRFVVGSFQQALPGARGPLDLVVSTLPNTPLGHRYARERAMRQAPLVSRHLIGGPGGSSLSALLVRAAAPLLSRSGRIHLHVVDWNDKAPIRAALRDAGLSPRLLARAHVPEWGQRCNAGRAFKRRALGKPWLIRYAELPRTPDTGVEVLEAAASRADGSPRRRPLPELQIEILAGRRT